LSSRGSGSGLSGLGLSNCSIHGVQHSSETGKGVAIVMGLSPQLQIDAKGPVSRMQEPSQPSPRVAIKVKGKILFINLSNVVAVQAEGNYVSLERNGSSYLLRESISAVAEKLEPQGFIRIHRSILVNTSFVEEIRPYSTGEYGLRVKGGKEYTVTRTYKKNLKSLAEFWIGAGAFFRD
ncbi:MAG: LytTR family DNA-binding domain-containing protein, partial [Candidatus Sulfotelmatobacter sp.]